MDESSEGKTVRVEKIEVIAYSGYRGEESPKAFFIHGERVDVVEIVKRWVDEDLEQRGRKRSFAVKGSDGYIHKLYFDESAKAWFKAE
jgi:hypothetical protein